MKILFSRVINLLLTKLARDRTGRISALCLFCTDLATLGPYCQVLGPILGTLRSDDDDATKTSLEKVTSRFFCYFAIIPIRSTCTTWAKYPGTKLIGVAFKLGRRMKNSPSCAHILHKTLNLVISRCCFAENGKEMYKNIQRTCRAIVFAN